MGQGLAAAMRGGLCSRPVSGFKVRGFRVHRVQGIGVSGFRVYGCRGLGFRVQDLWV